MKKGADVQSRKAKKPKRKTRTNAKLGTLSAKPAFRFRGALLETNNFKKLLKKTCEVACLDKSSQKRLWIVPMMRKEEEGGAWERGFGVFKTSFIGDSPREIGFAPTMSVARDFLFRNNGVPKDAWTPIPFISMLSHGATA